MISDDISWIGLAAISAVLLGLYDVTKKVAVKNNAVPIILLISVCIGAGLWSPFIIWSAVWPETVPFELLIVDTLSWFEHGLLLAKSILVGASWTFAFYALKELPISIASPIRSTSPMWTILIAATFLSERPAVLQWVGIAVVLIAFWSFSAVGLREGVSFSSNLAVGMMVAATVLGAISSIYDKVLLQTYSISPSTVQAWFSVYLVPVMIPMAVRWYLQQKSEASPRKSPLKWRPSILMISPLLLAADIVYFTALADPDAMVSIVSVVRRCSVVISFLFGIRALGELNFWPKAACVVAILMGVTLIAVGG